MHAMRKITVYNCPNFIHLKSFAKQTQRNTNLLYFVCVCVCVCVLIAQLCLTLCNPMDCSLPGFSVHGILQARILEWVVILFSRGCSNPGIRPRSPAWQADSLLSEPPGKPNYLCKDPMSKSGHILRGVRASTTYFGGYTSTQISP